jgi:hypothetical protein
MLGLGWYHFALAVLAFLTWWPARRVPHGRLWVCGIALSYVASVAFTRAHLTDAPWAPPAVTFLCDAALAYFIHAVHEDERDYWRLFVPFATSSMVSFIQTLAILSGTPPPLPVDAYSSILEAITAAALLMIGYRGVRDWADGMDLPRRHGRHASAPLVSAATSRFRPTRASKARWDWPRERGG